MSKGVGSNTSINKLYLRGNQIRDVRARGLGEVLEASNTQADLAACFLLWKGAVR